MKSLFFIKNLKYLVNILPILGIKVYNEDELNIVISKKNISNSLYLLKNHYNCQYKILSYISGIDYPEHKRRFKIVYDLLSLRNNCRIKIVIYSSNFTPITSSVKVFKTADWYESEIWDMFGVFFKNHNNLTRLLTDYGFEGYPLRKDFPLSGFLEINYDYVRKHISNVKLELSQEYRTFKFQSPWEHISF